MSQFEELPKAWQDAINEEISQVDAGNRPAIAQAFKEREAKYLMENEISDEPDENDRYTLGNDYILFASGWEARPTLPHTVHGDH